MTLRLLMVASAFLQCPISAYAEMSEHCQLGECMPPLDDAGALIQSTFSYVEDSDTCQLGACMPPLDDAGALFQSKAKVYLDGEVSKFLNSSENSTLQHNALEDASKGLGDSMAAAEKSMQGVVEELTRTELQRENMTTESLSVQEVVQQVIDSSFEKAEEVARQVMDSSMVEAVIWASPFIFLGMILLIVIGLLILIFVILATTPCWLGPAVRILIEGLDKELLGVDIVVDSISVCAFSARVAINGFKVCNPPGYKAPHMVEIDTLLLDLNFCVLLWSLLKFLFASAPIQVIVSHFVFVKFHTMVEKNSFHTSNVKQVLAHLTEQHKKLQEDPGKIDTSGKTVDTGGPNHWILRNKPQITVKEIKIRDIDVRFQVEGQIFGKSMGTGCDIAIADIEYKDFSKERGSFIADDIALVVLETSLKTIVTNIAGRRVGNHIF